VETLVYKIYFLIFKISEQSYIFLNGIKEGPTNFWVKPIPVMETHLKNFKNILLLFL
jgi:hypothetical protein